MSANRIRQPIDKLAIALIASLALIIGLLVWGENACGTTSNCMVRTGAKVSNFSWQDRSIGKEDNAFILSFNRPMNRASVEDHLKITPTLPGKISWSGLRLAYTLNNPVPYGQTYQISLTEATDKFSTPKKHKPIQPFQAQFNSRDRAFVYIGSQEEEKDRLVLFNWTQQQKKILTPPNLTVFDFSPYPQGDHLLFSAADAKLGIKGFQRLQLYTVTTSLKSTTAKKSSPQIELVLDNRDYQNNKFDLSQDGKIIVVQRLERHNPNNYGLWQINDGKTPQLLTRAPVGDFLITPDSQTVAVAQGEGIALLPLEADAQPLDFLPKFGQVLDFTADGTGAAMINYNTDDANLSYTRSLFYVDNQGRQKELLTTEGSIQNCQFDPTATNLYCWLTKLEKGQEYIEKPYLTQIDLKTGKAKTLVNLKQYQDSKLSVAPDELGILFERSPENYPNVTDSLTTISKSIWLLIPTAESNVPSFEEEELPFIGFRPQWLP